MPAPVLAHSRDAAGPQDQLVHLFPKYHIVTCPFTHNLLLTHLKVILQCLINLSMPTHAPTTLTHHHALDFPKPIECAIMF